MDDTHSGYEETSIVSMSLYYHLRIIGLGEEVWEVEKSLPWKTALSHDGD